MDQSMMRQTASTAQEKLQDRLKKLEMCLEFNRELVLELDLSRLLELVVDRASRMMDADRSSLYVLDAEKQEIWTRVAQGVEEIRLPLGKGIAGRVAQVGEVDNVADAYSVPYFDATWDRKHGYETRSVLCVPLRARDGKVIGVFEVLNKRDGLFDSEDEYLLLALGAGVAVALENALLVTALKQANQKIAETYEQLLQLEKLSTLGLLAGTIAHDVQNPLGVIMGHAEVLQRRFSGQDDVARASRAILEQVDRITELVETVQNFARKDSHEFGEVDLARLLREVLMLTERLLTRRHVEVVQHIPRGLPPVWGNASQLEQVFMNLIQNAAQAMESGGTLRMETRFLADAGWVEVAISDTGGGIPVEAEMRIFDAFFTTKRQVGGTGLGLAICRRIVEMHQGQIELQNRPGHGATFLVRLRTDP